MIQEIKIPFNIASFQGNEYRYIQEVCESGRISGDGQFTKKCNSFIEKYFGVPKALLTTSCTHALEMSAILLDIKPGDEIIVPSFTFVSTINAFVLRGAKPIFIDIRPDTLNMDYKLLEGLITPRTRAIIPVHYAGVSCEMDTIMEIANRYQIPVIEDNAHGLFGKYRGKYLGTFGIFASQSFHETKNLTCGEGGAILINDPQYIQRAEIIREKGTNRSRFFRGEVDRYTWIDIGSSYLPSDILAAILYAQFEASDQIQAKRQKIWQTYYESLKDWSFGQGVGLPVIPEYCEQPYHMFYMILPSFEYRQGLIQHLRDRGIHSVFHYLPLNLSNMGRGFGGKAGDCPVTEEISERLLRLPFYNSLSDDDQAWVVEGVLAFMY